MNKVNYQRKTERAIQRLCAEGRRPRLLLHACCAPCSSYVLEYLSEYFDLTIFFCNPNITNPAEYCKRLDELRRLCREAPFCRGIEVVEDSVSSGVFLAAVSGLEAEPEGGKRCGECFRLRLSRTAEYARTHGFPLFATTLTVSPHKDAERINLIGQEIAGTCGPEYLPSDFKKRGGYERSLALSAEYGLYRQSFCGCAFSARRDGGNG
ncbi:MAG: epoxyqueuosine reductase QueH [Oscillospiraceae bacterium]|nr:epoxyqueuosine reductase QueH [Oscillospiraceae bacterium]